jgi:hypothetical protein
LEVNLPNAPDITRLAVAVHVELFWRGIPKEKRKDWRGPISISARRHKPILIQACGINYVYIHPGATSCLEHRYHNEQQTYSPLPKVGNEYSGIWATLFQKNVLRLEIYQNWRWKEEKGGKLD